MAITRSRTRETRDGYRQETRLIDVRTPLGEDVLLLLSFRGREELSRLFSYELEMAGQRDDIEPAELVGKSVTFTVEKRDKTKRYFNGYVRRLIRGPKEVRNLRRYRAEVVPWLWFLTRTADCRIFQEMTAPQIIEKIFQDLGFQDYQPDLRESHPRREYCVQYRETDFDFVSRLLEEEGMFYFFRHEEGKHTLVIADKKEAYQQCEERQIRYSPGTLIPDHITSWSHSFEYRPGKWAQTDYNFKTPSTPLMTNTQTVVSLPGNSSYEIYDYPGEYLVKSDGETLTRMRMEEEETPHDVVEGDSLWLDDYKVPALPDPGLTPAGDAGGRALRNDLLVDLYGGPASFATYSLVDLYLCAQQGDAGFFGRNFADKVVLFGSVLDVEDRVLTSVRHAQPRAAARPAERCVLAAGADGRAAAPREEIPGLYVHAAAVANLLERRVLRPLDRYQQFLCAAVLALLVAGLALRVGSATGALAFAGLSLGWGGVAFGGFLAGLVLPLFQPVFAGGLSLAALLGYRFAVTDRTERRIRRAFGTILAPSLVERMVATGQMPAQGGELREVTVWISDLQNYTTISEILEPPELVRFLNRVYTVMSDTIEAHGGFVAQFVGDAVVAGFNLPLDDPDHARFGIEAAMACCREVDALGRGMELPGNFEVRIRVGVSTGELLVGYIGSERRLSYTLVGDDINLASRLEGVNKLYGSQILVNELTKELCGPSVAFREVDIVRVKGREQPVRIFEPLGPAAAVTEAQQSMLARFAEGLAAFRARRFKAAAEIFGSLADEDPVSRSYAKRARAFATDPPPADWDGVNTLLSK